MTGYQGRQIRCDPGLVIVVLRVAPSKMGKENICLLSIKSTLESNPGVNILRLLGDKIVEVRSFYNAYELWQQLGYFPKNGPRPQDEPYATGRA
jgi:hypothetical protein